MAGPVLLGRLCHALLPSLNGSLARPLACLASSSCMLDILGLDRGPRWQPTWSAQRQVASTAETSLGSVPSPARAAGESREAWRPVQQGPPTLALESDSGGALNRTEGESDAPRRGAEIAAGVSSPDPPASPLDEVFKTLTEMGLQPGRNCVVGDGLAEVDVGLYLDGVKVALEMEAEGGPRGMVLDARSYSMKRALRSVLQAHGWHSVSLKASDWKQLDSEQRTHYLAFCINHALGHGKEGHHHHQGHQCGNGHHHHPHPHGHQCGHGHGHEHSEDGHEHGKEQGGCCGSGCGNADQAPK